MSRTLSRAALAVIWLLIVAIVSVGAAGIVAAMANQPGTPSRAELTQDGDAAANVVLSKAAADLDDLTGHVERLGQLGRGALTSLVSSDFDAMDKAVAEGQTLAHEIEQQSAAIRAELLAIPGTGPGEPLIWSPETIRRRDVTLAALDATGGLEISWTRLASGSTVANRLTGLLSDHDLTAAAAAKQYSNRGYATSLKTLARAKAMLDGAKTLRDALQNTVDVTTLTQWIDRNAEYDAALERLIKATVAAKGRVTNELKAAYRAEIRAHQLLPSNTSGIVIILAEIGRGGLNEAVIGIEGARAKLQAASDELAGPPPDASGEPGTAPDASGG
ncbi:MAG TPA: hypothetical protein VFJ71_03545 [Candidatus Limnocylindrales bacterium]|nr:hypothetical protein [Candidatus Limnocylindrales bacterium]